MKRMFSQKNLINSEFIKGWTVPPQGITSICLPVIAGLFLFSCEDKIIEKYKVNAPVYMSYKELRSSVKSMPVTETKITKPGKIYYWNNYLFVNEYSKGIHVIDNTNPSNPVFKTFINIPGNVDMSIKDGIL